MGEESVLIVGKTYPVRDKLRALGGKWDPQAKGWRVPAASARAAQALVTDSRGKRTGCSCGSYPGTCDCASVGY